MEFTGTSGPCGGGTLVQKCAKRQMLKPSGTSGTSGRHRERQTQTHTPAALSRTAERVQALLRLWPEALTVAKKNTSCGCVVSGRLQRTCCLLEFSRERGTRHKLDVYREALILCIPPRHSRQTSLIETTNTAGRSPLQTESNLRLSRHASTTTGILTAASRRRTVPVIKSASQWVLNWLTNCLATSLYEVERGRPKGVGYGF